MAREEEEGGGALEPEELPGGLGGRMFGLVTILAADTDSKNESPRGR